MAMAAAVEFLLMEPTTRRVARSLNLNVTEDAFVLADDHGQSVLSKMDTSVALERITVWMMS